MPKRFDNCSFPIKCHSYDFTDCFIIDGTCHSQICYCELEYFTILQHFFHYDVLSCFSTSIGNIGFSIAYHGGHDLSCYVFSFLDKWLPIIS